MNTIRRIIPGLFAIVTLFGCATTPNWQDSYGKILATTAQTVDAAMKGWAMYVVTGNPPADQQAKVKTAYQEYQAAFDVALNAYNASVALKDASLFEQAQAALEAN